jgi:hypothetical protein
MALDPFTPITQEELDAVRRIHNELKVFSPFQVARIMRRIVYELTREWAEEQHTVETLVQHLSADAVNPEKGKGDSVQP